MTDYLTTDELNLLLARAKGGDILARNRIIASHLNFVRKLVKKIVKTQDDWEDCVQSAAIAMNRAVDLFDASKGFTFMTYASHWIRQGIFEYLRNKPLVRLTSHEYPLFYKVPKLRAQGLKTVEEISAATGETERTVTSVLAKMRRVDYLHRVLADHHGGDSLRTLGDTLETGEPSAEDKTINLEEEYRRRDLVGHALRGLDPRSRDIIERRYLGEKPETLRGIGRSYGMSGERVRQLEKLALAKLAVTLKEVA